jgi:hypothetical protein
MDFAFPNREINLAQYEIPLKRLTNLPGAQE